MAKLELVGLHDDGEHLVLKDASGKSYQVAIDETLRAAVRRDRPQLEQLRSSTIRPRDIQALIRSGASAEDVAEQAGVSVEYVRRYEGPVLAERAFTAEKARALRVTRAEDAPALGDLVVDRLAARQVTDVAWDAYRPDGEAWHVTAYYRAGEQDFVATWSVNLTSATFEALDDEARWLSEIDLAASPYRHLAPVEDRFYDVEADGDLPAEQGGAGNADGTESILAELDAARGVRQPLEPDAHATPTLWDDPPAAHPPHSRPQDATDATVLRMPEQGQGKQGQGSGEDASDPPAEHPAEHRGEPPGKSPADSPEQPPTRKRSRRERTSVPSWDEIVFGAKND